MTFSDVCRVYKQTTGEVLPVKAIILDGDPGDPSFREGWEAVSSSDAIPKGFLWFPVAAAVVIVLGFIWFGKNVLGIKMLVDLSRGLLNDEELVDGQAKRLYIYGEADRVVGWRDVERHAEDARRNGWGVKMLNEAESPHVQHIMLDKKRYWECVEDLWQDTR